MILYKNMGELINQRPYCKWFIRPSAIKTRNHFLCPYNFFKNKSYIVIYLKIYKLKSYFYGKS